MAKNKKIPSVHDAVSVIDYENTPESLNMLCRYKYMGSGRGSNLALVTQTACGHNAQWYFTSRSNMHKFFQYGYQNGIRAWRNLDNEKNDDCKIYFHLSGTVRYKPAYVGSTASAKRIKLHGIYTPNADGSALIRNFELEDLIKKEWEQYRAQYPEKRAFNDVSFL